MTPDQHKSRIGCVSFLNARPLINRLARLNQSQVLFDVPSRLLKSLQQAKVDIALCPVIDFQLSDQPLVIVPVGGIGCDGPTLTVRLYSKIPINEIKTIHADTDSHTSVCLTRIILKEQFDCTPELIDYKANSGEKNQEYTEDTYLLIGDKVVTQSPDDEVYNYQLDLGQAWKELTGLSFVFAIWMTRENTALGNVPELLTEEREYNADRIAEIVDELAVSMGWPAPLANEYLGHLLKFETGQLQLEAIVKFWDYAYKHGITTNNRPLNIYSDCPTGTLEMK